MSLFTVRRYQRICNITHIRSWNGFFISVQERQTICAFTERIYDYGGTRDTTVVWLHIEHSFPALVAYTSGSEED